jgi:SAM-dependent methyltransferase
MPPPEQCLHLDTPSDWVRRFAALLPAGGSVLDVACGGGRHLRWLLDRGFAVTGIDRDTRFVGDLTEHARILTADLEDGSPWPVAGQTFDGIVVTNYLHRPLFPRLVEALTDGGVLIYETFARGNEAYGRPRNPDHLLRDGELLAAFAPPLQVVAYEHGVADRCGGAKVIERIACVKTDAPVPVG